MKKQSIFIPTGSFYPNQKNGPSLSLYWLSKCLTEGSYDVTIYTTNDGVDDLKSDELLILDYGKVKYIDLGYFNFPIKLIFECITTFYKYDIIIITSIFYPLSAILIFFSFFFSKKIIISPRGELFDNSINSTKKQLKLFYIRVLNYFLRYRAKNYLFHSTSIQELETIRKFFNDNVKIEIIPNFIYMPIRLNKTYSRKYVLFLGRIHSDKALDKLIDAFYLIKRNYDSLNLRLVLTGGKDSKYARDLIHYIKFKGLEQDIDLVGFVEGKDKSELIANK
jgi:glycosyltransferase involved in cell wall biosynthesis